MIFVFTVVSVVLVSRIINDFLLVFQVSVVFNLSIFGHFPFLQK